MAEKKPVQHGTAYKATEIALGVASVVSIVLGFIPGFNFAGMAIQGGVTLIQSGMDLATEGPGKAARTFAVGALITGMMAIPVLGSAARLAKGAAAVEGTGKALQIAEAGTAAASETGGIWAAVKGMFSTAKSAVKGAAGKTGTFLAEKVPGVQAGVDGLKTFNAAGIKALQNNRMAARAGEFIVNNPGKATAMEWGLGGASSLASYQQNIPPGNLARAETYDFSKPEDASAKEDTRWRSRIEAEQQQRAKTADTPG